MNGTISGLKEYSVDLEQINCCNLCIEHVYLCKPNITMRLHLSSGQMVSLGNTHVHKPYNVSALYVVYCFAG